MKRKKLFFIIIVILVVISVGLFTLYRSEDVRHFLSLGKGDDQAPSVTSSQAINDTRARLILPSEKGLLRREIALRQGLQPLERADAIVGEYLKGLGEGLRETRLLGIYKDRGNVLYIDLSGEFAQGFSGDARDEYLLMKSLWDTVSGNLSWVADVRILIEGKERESIGGHLSALGGLREMASRGE